MVGIGRGYSPLCLTIEFLPSCQGRLAIGFRTASLGRLAILCGFFVRQIFEKAKAFKWAAGVVGVAASCTQS